MVKNKNITYILLLAGVALCLLQIWLPAYYITGDGPCHLYNARVLHDLWSHKNTDFYSRFYTQVGKPNPNWMSHLLLALFMFVFNGVTAEKVLLTCYVLLFLSGFYALLKRLDNRSNTWLLVIFIFVFHQVLSKGFYNFSFSIAFLFWLTEAWLRYLDNKRWGSILLFFFLSLLTFFAHPMAFVFGCFGCFALTLSDTLASSVVGKIRTLASRLLVLLLCLLPCLSLFTWFAAQEGGAGNIDIHLYGHRVTELLNLPSLVNVTTKEIFAVTTAWILICILLLLSLVIRFRKKVSFHKFDGFFILFAFALFVYLFFPDNLLGGSVFIVRVQFLIAVYCVCSIGYMLPAGKMKNIAGLLLFCCFAGLGIIRIPCREVASSGVADIASASKYIKPYSVVLPLNFSPGGKDESGKTIADANWLFCHAWQYLGSEKPLIILDNYEANTGYFPLVWKDEANPYHHLCTNGTIEALPPYANIGDYKKTSGVTIDYILMWCYNNSWLQDENFRKFYAEINAGYHIVYISPTGRSVLFAK